MFNNHLMKACLAAVFAIGLAACSSSSDTATDTSPADQGPTQEQQLAALQQEIADLRAQLGITDADDVGDSVAALQAEVTRLQGELEDKEDAEAEAAAMANAAKLNKLAEAIGAVDSGDLDAHVQTTTAKPDTATDGDAPHAISGWNGASYSVTAADDSTTMTVVYNDKAADTASTFNKRFTIIAAGQTNEGTVALTVADHGKLVGGISGLPTHPSHAGVNVGVTNGVRGTLAGAAGTFLGVGAPAVVGLDGDGNLTWTGTLHFKPDSATASVMMPDTTYMNLGWWLVSDADGQPTDVMVAAWGTGTAYDEGTKMGALIGKATFNGIAVGKYTHKTINSISGGHFNADAELVADFGDATDQGTLTGTIDNFMQDGTPIASGWKIELGAAATGTPLAFDPEAGATITGGAVADTENGAQGTFGTQKTLGTWNAMFVGDDRNDNMPGGVTGTFHVGQTAHPINMVGGFAASNQETDLPDN